MGAKCLCGGKELKNEIHPRQGAVLHVLQHVGQFGKGQEFEPEDLGLGYSPSMWSNKTSLASGPLYLENN